MGGECSDACYDWLIVSTRLSTEQVAPPVLPLSRIFFILGGFIKRGFFILVGFNKSEIYFRLCCRSYPSELSRVVEKSQFKSYYGMEIEALSKNLNF